jgi:hypothetical protein
MRFWTRELGGWLLVVLGLLVFGLCILFLQNAHYPRVIEVGPLLVIGIFVFRGGIHLLKVAVAARICLASVEPVAGRPAQGRNVRPGR